MIRGDFDRAASYQQRAAALARDVGNDAWPAIKRRLGNRWSLLYSELIAAAIDMTARRYEQAIKRLSNGD
jgi:hypothetical protein